MKSGKTYAKGLDFFLEMGKIDLALGDKEC